MEKELTYGLRSLYYALKTDSGYADPIAIPGAVKINLTPEVIEIAFTGLDCIPQNKISMLCGYKGNLTIACVTRAMRRDIYGYTVDADGSEIEKITVDLPVCALLFETKGLPPTRYCYYACTLGRAELVSETKTDTAVISTYSVPIIVRANADGNFKKMNSNVSSEAYRNWFEAVI